MLLNSELATLHAVLARSLFEFYHIYIDADFVLSRTRDCDIGEADTS